MKFHHQHATAQKRNHPGQALPELKRMPACFVWSLASQLSAATSTLLHSSLFPTKGLPTVLDVPAASTWRPGSSWLTFLCSVSATSCDLRSDGLSMDLLNDHRHCDFYILHDYVWCVTCTRQWFGCLANAVTGSRPNC